jgi:hypothetical protein
LDTDLLERVLLVQSCSGSTKRMRRLIKTICAEKGATVWSDKQNVYAVKGNAETYPCVVAHTDTVHRIVPDDRYNVSLSADRKYFAWDSKTNDYLGVGGDDKCGIFIGLAMLDLVPNIKLAFFRDEEIGCKGSFEADMDFFSDVGIVLQADRRGTGDFVTEIGGLGVSTANLSAGYHNPHSRYEYIDADELELAHDLIHDLVATLGAERWDWFPPPKPKAKVLWWKGGKPEVEAKPTDDVSEWNRYLAEEDGWDNWKGWQDAHGEEEEGAQFRELDDDPPPPVCPTCGTPTWIEWDDLEDEWVCLMCDYGYDPTSEWEVFDGGFGRKEVLPLPATTG